ncbi:hypothetical protein ACLMAJ_25920 [Nocardia sp. KC 131]|uniref:hypothetical protein n=1 Tax=Nocardia arseniciresistens TaxID=3392119 RepID=UPI00398E9ED9
MSSVKPPTAEQSSSPADPPEQAADPRLALSFAVSVAVAAGLLTNWSTAATVLLEVIALFTALAHRQR